MRRLNIFSKSAAWVLAAGLVFQAVFIQTPVFVQAANGHDDPGTQITNSATATYKDANNNSYTTQSNTVTATVQNAPSVTNTAGTGITYAPGQQVTDTFTLLNTGNAAGYFQLTSDATLGGTDAGSATLGNGAATCVTPLGSQSAPCLYAATVAGTTYYFTSFSGTDNKALNYWLQHTNALTAANAGFTVTAYYALSAAASSGSLNTVTSTLSTNILYAAAGSAPQELSATTSVTETNQVQSDARLDLYQSIAQNSSTGDLTLLVYAHNASTFPAKDLQSAKTLLGAPTNGILITDAVPSFAGVVLKLSNNGAVTTTGNTSYGFATGAVLDTYFSTSPTGAQGSWTKATGNLPTDGTVTFIGVFIHGGTCSSAGFELCGDVSHATTPGNISVLSSAAVQFAFTVVQPSGAGSGEVGAVTNLADGVIGDSLPTEHILGPGIAGGTADTASSIVLTTAGQAIENTALASVGGASNRTAGQALSGFQPSIGPLGADASQGSYDSAAAASASNDFTAVGFTGPDSVVNTSTTPGTPTTATVTTAAETMCVGGTVDNTGNRADTINIVAYAPTAFAVPATGGQSFTGSFSAGGTQVTGWAVSIYSDSACSSPLGGSVPGALSSTAASISMASDFEMPYYVKYAAPIGTHYLTRFDSVIVAQSNGNLNKYNTTHDELYSGFLAVTMSQAVVSTNCPAGVAPGYAAGTACPGDVINYTIDYRNIVLGQTDTNISFAQVVANASNVNSTDDGTLSSSPSSTTVNNWGYFTTGLQTPPVDHTSTGAINPYTTYLYATGAPHGAYSATFTAGATAVQVVPYPAAQVVPQAYVSPNALQNWQGFFTFSLTVK